MSRATMRQKELKSRCLTLLRSNPDRPWSEAVITLVGEKLVKDTPEDRQEAAALFDTLGKQVKAELAGASVAVATPPKPRGRPRKYAASPVVKRTRDRSQKPSDAGVTPTVTKPASPFDRGLALAMNESGGSPLNKATFSQACETILTIKQFNDEMASNYEKQHAAGAVDFNGYHLKFADLVQRVGLENITTGSAVLHKLTENILASRAPESHTPPTRAPQGTAPAATTAVVPHHAETAPSDSTFRLPVEESEPAPV